MKKIVQNIPYKHRVALTILLFALLPSIFLESLYLKNLRNEAKQAALADYQDTIDATALMTSKKLIELQEKMEYLRNSSSIRSSIAQINKLSLVQKLDLITTFDEMAGSITADNKELVVRWYPHLSPLPYGRYCYTLDMLAQDFEFGTQDADYLKIISLDEGQFLWMIQNVARGINNTGTAEPRLCLYTSMTNLNGSNCVLEFSVPISWMNESNSTGTIPNSLLAICISQDEAPVNIILDSSFSQNQAETLITQYQHNEKLTEAGYDILYASIPSVTDSEVIFILPASYAQEQLQPQIVSFIIISILIAILIISASYLTSHFLTRRIMNTLTSMNTDLKDILNEPRDTDYSLDDIDQISLRVRKLIQDTQEYCARIEHYEAENLRMELELLQMRFNPHFLYNTLGAIRYQVKSPETRSSIDSLCHYYRIVLNNGHLIIRIKDEIEMIKEYLSIEKFAYHLDNISYEFEIDERVAQLTIIKHLLQPIVENALNHGIRAFGLNHNGILRISAVSEDDCICIQITDNGVGMSHEDTEKLLAAPSANVSGHGYGIYNVQQRVRVYYGKEYGLKIDSIIGKGTTVTLRIPAIPSGDILC